MLGMLSEVGYITGAEVQPERGNTFLKLTLDDGSGGCCDGGGAEKFAIFVLATKLCSLCCALDERESGMTKGK